ncbi:ATP-grasp domain-containing protein [Paenibacillus sp. NRS-1782]|uniref:ATP-grasp domain-containing protein n=1 Tax=unclassified Paenibacillus TaxID=185978 RepID=UPI003D2A2173
MQIIFGSSPLNERKVDENYEMEYKYAKQLGLEVGLINLEELILNNNPQSAIQNLKKVSEKETVIFRGWMLKAYNYQLLYNAMKSKKLDLINTPENYIHCHHLPESYELIQDLTPLTVWLDKSDIDDSFDKIYEKVKIFSQAPIIIKDFVKSRKHEWNEACFIPDASDKKKVYQVVNRFLELQNDELNEGIVFRKYIKLEFLTYHSLSNMPLSKEFRIFFLDGEAIFISEYWDEGQYDNLPPDLSPFLEIAKRIKSRFFTMDIAKTEGGSWIILELGDAQVAGLPDQANILDFYTKLKNSIG